MGVMLISGIKAYPEFWNARRAEKEKNNNTHGKKKEESENSFAELLGQEERKLRDESS